MSASQGFWEPGNWGIYFRETEGQNPNFEETGEQRQYRDIRKQNYRLWKTGEQPNLFQGNKGTGTPPPMGGYSLFD